MGKSGDLSSRSVGGQSGGRTDRGTTRRQEILTVAEGVFASKGYRTATVRDIAERVGIGSGSLYHHFRSKDEIVEELVGNFLERVLGRLGRAVAEGTGPEDTLRRLIAENMAIVQERRAVVTLLYNDWPILRTLPEFEPLNRMYRSISKLWIDVLQQGVDDGTFVSTLDLGLVYRSIQASVLSTVRWFDRNGRLSAQQVAEQQMTLLLGGLLERR
jgi:AcrR family transcriptional regulator